MRANTLRKGSFTFVRPTKIGSKLLKFQSKVSKERRIHSRPQTKHWVFLVLMGLIIPNLSFSPDPLEADDEVNVVVIDPGHGGHDPGNLGTGRYAHKEKDISLKVSLMVGNYIEENFPNVQVIYTRKDDRKIELRERCEMANRAGADLFISIHCNSATASSAYGTETFVMGLSREEANLEVSRRENSVIFLEENYEENYEGYDPNSPLSNIFSHLSQSAYLDNSVEFASLVQSQFRERVQRRDRGVKQSILYVLDFTAMPSVLVELGFLSNRSEEDFLNTQRGQELMASGIFRAFREYKRRKDAINQGLHRSDSNRSEQLEVVETPEVVEPTAPEFAVQIMVSGNEIELVPENFGGLEGVTYFTERNLNKYILGRFATKAEAEEARNYAREAGFGDAYLIAFFGDEKISVSEAESMLE